MQAKRKDNGELYEEDFPNTGKYLINKEAKIERLVHGCYIKKTPCYFPMCENNIACKQIDKVKQEDPDVMKKGELKKPSVTGEGKVTSLDQFFTHQKELNTLEDEMTKLKNQQKDLYKDIKTDIETVFIALDCEEPGTEIEITQKGIEIIYPVRVYNDYETLKVNTDLFTQLNKLIGMNGTMSIQSQTKVAGNIVYKLTLKYELE